MTQAIELHLAYIPLVPPINLCCSANATQYATATVNARQRETKSGSPQVIDITLIGTPTAAGTAFVKYTVAGLAQYKAGGFTVLTPTVVGDERGPARSPVSWAPSPAAAAGGAVSSGTAGRPRRAGPQRIIGAPLRARPASAVVS